MSKHSADVGLGGNVVIEVLVCVTFALGEDGVVSLVVMLTVAVVAGGGGGGLWLELLLLLLSLRVVFDGEGEEEGNASTKVVDIGRLGVWSSLAMEGNANEYCPEGSGITETVSVVVVEAEEVLIALANFEDEVEGEVEREMLLPVLAFEEA